LTLPGGQTTEVAIDRNAVVQFDKIQKYPRGKSIPYTAEMADEARNLRKLRHSDPKSFGADPSNAKRLDELDRLKHNFERSTEMAETLQKAGIPNTPEANDALMKHLLEVGQNMNESNRTSFPSVFSGPNGNVKILSTWKILPDGRAYLATFNLIPKF